MLTEFPLLKSVLLHQTANTDKGLGHLAKIQTLTELNISTCLGITEPVVRKLQAELPNCKIDSDYPDVATMPETKGAVEPVSELDPQRG